MNKLHYTLLFVASLFIYSCSDVDPFEIDDVDFGDPEIGVPLVNSTFFVSDLSTDPNDNTEIKIDSEGKVTVLYTDEIKPVPASDVFPVATDEIAILSANTTVAVFLPFNDVGISHGVFKNSRISLNVQSQQTVPVLYRITIPEITHIATGEVFSKAIDLPPNFNGNTDPFLLEGYQVDTDMSVLNVSTEVISFGSGSVGAALNFERIDFSYLEGVFNNTVHEIPEEKIPIDLFEKWISGGMFLENPALQVTVENSLGVPLALDFQHAQISTYDGEVLDVTSPLLTDGIDFDYPAISELGTTKSTTVSFNKDNSNLNELFEKKPTEVSYDLDVVVNPDQDPNTIGFYSDQSYFNLQGTAELPLHFIANDLVMQDIFGFEDIDLEELDDAAELHLELINSFPIEVGINLDFLDANNAVLFSLVETDEWVKAIASPDPLLDFPDLEAQKTIIPISQQNVLQIPNVANVRIRTKVTTTEAFGNDYVWVYEHHGIDVKLGAVVK